MTCPHLMPLAATLAPWWHFFFPGVEGGSPEIFILFRSNFYKPNVKFQKPSYPPFCEAEKKNKKFPLIVATKKHRMYFASKQALKNSQSTILSQTLPPKMRFKIAVIGMNPF
jgi:hypothetical protein